jgi:uncharacterized membrane protein
VPHTDDPRTIGERVSDAIARFGGSWRFILLAVSVIALWVGWNLLAPHPFDPYPFILLNLFLSLVAAFQAPFILMSQHRQEKKTDSAYRALFGELKLNGEKSLAHERQMLKILKTLEPPRPEQPAP